MFYPGQHVIARDGREHVLAFFMEGVWFGWSAGALSGLPRPVEPRYACWGGDDERGSADQHQHLPRPWSRGVRRRSARR